MKWTVSGTRCAVRLSHHNCIWHRSVYSKFWCSSIILWHKTDVEIKWGTLYSILSAFNQLKFNSAKSTIITRCSFFSSKTYLPLVNKFFSAAHLMLHDYRQTTGFSFSNSSIYVANVLWYNLMCTLAAVLRVFAAMIKQNLIFEIYFISGICIQLQ